VIKDINFIDDVDIKGKRVLIRVDFNVPLNSTGQITDDTRIRSELPTINYALDEGAKVILASHFARPMGKRVPGLSLAPVAKRLGRLLDKEVKMSNDCVSEETRNMVANMKPGDVLLLENLRFHPEEEENDNEFGKKLAALADVYINDAFATAHRSHASNVAVTRFIGLCAAGLLMKLELNYFEMAMASPSRPLVAIIGGKKVSDKVGVILSLCKKVDKLIIGGGMALTFFKSLGYETGKSFVDNKVLDTCKSVIDYANKNQIKLYLPIDFVVADKFDQSAETKVVTSREILKDWMALDIGPATVTLFSEVLQNAKTVVWNGPMGVYEMDAFSRGTLAMVNIVANSYALTIVGGGDTDVCMHRAGQFANMSYVSTGGGAFLELLEGNNLPAIVALRDCYKMNNAKVV